MAYEIHIPHRSDPLSPEEAEKALGEGLYLIHCLIGGRDDQKGLPKELIKKSHDFFISVQGVGEARQKPCGCQVCT